MVLLRYSCFVFTLGLCLADEACTTSEGFLESGPRQGVSPALLQLSSRKGDTHGTTSIHVAYATTMNSTGPGDVGLMSSTLSLSRAMSNHDLVIHLIVPPEDLPSAKEWINCFHSQFDLSDAQPRVELHPEIPLPFKPPANDHTVYLSENTMTFARWYLPQYLPEVSTVLYIDTDTVVQGDVAELFLQHPDVAIKLKPCGLICRDETLEVHYADEKDRIPQDVSKTEVMNAGVMLANLDLWRTMNITGRLFDMADSFLEKKSFLDDQLILNIVARQSKSLLYLDEKFNKEGAGYVQSCDTPYAQDFYAVIHWSGPQKSWNWLGQQPRGSCFADKFLPPKTCKLSSGSLPSIPERDLPMIFMHDSDATLEWKLYEPGCMMTTGWNCPYPDASAFEIDDVEKTLQKLEVVKKRSLEEMARAKEIGDARTAEIAERKHKAASHDSVNFAAGTLRLSNPSLSRLPESSTGAWLAAFQFQTNEFLSAGMHYQDTPSAKPGWYSNHIVLALLNSEMKPVGPVRVIGSHDLLTVQGASLQLSDSESSIFECQPSASSEGSHHFGLDNARLLRGPNSEDIFMFWSGRELYSRANTTCTSSSGRRMYMSKVTSDLRLQGASSVAVGFDLNVVENTWAPFTHKSDSGHESLLFLSSANPHVVANLTWLGGVPAVSHAWNTESQLLSAWMSRHNIYAAEVGASPMLYLQDGQYVYLSILHAKQPYCNYTDSYPEGEPPSALLEYKAALYAFQASPPFEIVGISDKWLPLQPKRVTEGTKLASVTSLLDPSKTGAEEFWVMYGQGDCQSERLVLNTTEFASYLPQ